jgi:phage terminase large subunit GpA-like protein
MRIDGVGPDLSGPRETDGVSAGTDSVKAAELFGQWCELWRPPKRLPLSQWAEENFVLSSEYSATSGKIRLYGYQREPFDCFTDPRVTDIVLKVSTQVIKTLFIQVALAYTAIEDPGPTLISQPKEADAENFSKDRLANMVRDNAALRRIISDPKARSSSNTILYKEFPGGSWSIVGAGVPGNAARRSIRYYFADEIDKYESTKEGTFTELADRRTATFGARAKRVYCCSPTTPDSAIARKYRQSDQREPWVPCGYCGEIQILKWSQVGWDKTVPLEDRPETAYYSCEHCRAQWNDVDRWRASEQTKWIAKYPFRGVAGFGSLSQLYRQNYPLSRMVRLWLSISAEKSAEAIDDLRTFVNTDLAEDFVEKGDAPEWQRLYERSRISYPFRIVPEGGLFITAGADVQKDRIEVYPYAWGRGKRSWCIDQVILAGDTSRPEVWGKLSEFLSQTYTHERGCEMSIIRLAIDSGYATQEVYAWARKQGPGQVMVIKGSDLGRSTVGTPTDVDINIRGKKIARGVKVWPLNVSLLKQEFYRWLKLERPTDEEIVAGQDYPPGFCHFPAFDSEFFEQLVAEQLVTHLIKGYQRQEWIKTRERNEALDCRNYARAAAENVGLDRFDKSEEWWQRLEMSLVDQLGKPIEPPKQQLAANPAPVVPPKARENSGWIPRQRGWLNR